MRKSRLDAFYFGFPRAVGWSGLVGQGPVQLQLLGGKQRVLDRRMVLMRPPSRWIDIIIVRQRAEAEWMIWKTGSYRRGPTSQSRR